MLSLIVTMTLSLPYPSIHTSQLLLPIRPRRASSKDKQRIVYKISIGRNNLTRQSYQGKGGEGREGQLSGRD